MGFGDFSDEKEPIGAVKQATKSAVKSVGSGVAGQVKGGVSDFFGQLLGDLSPVKTDTSSQQSQQNQATSGGAMPAGLSNPGEHGTEQPQDQAAQLMKQAQQQQAVQPQQNTSLNGNDNQGNLSPEEQRKLQQLRDKLHKETYWNEFGDTETLMKKSEQLKKQEEQQDKQEEEQNKQQKKQEEQQEKKERIEAENRNAKKMEAPAGAG